MNERDRECVHPACRGERQAAGALTVVLLRLNHCLIRKESGGRVMWVPGLLPFRLCQTTVSS